MASTFSDRLRFELQTNGENDSTWGTQLNAAISRIDDSIAGMATIATTGGSTTLTANNGTADESRMAIIKVTGVLVSNATLVIPAETKPYVVWNATTGSYTTTLKTSGGTGVAVTQGKKSYVFCDGTDCFAAVGDISLTADVAGILPTANGGTGIAYFTAAGPTVARVYTFPDAAATVLTTNATVTVVQGGTGIASGTSGGIPYFSGTTSIASSAALAANAIVLGGGAGVAPATTTTGTGVVTALGVNVGSAGAFVTNGGAGGTPSSLTLTNATGLPAAGVTGTAAILGANTFTGDQTLAENVGIVLDSALSADGKYSGVVEAGTSAAALVFGELCYLVTATGKWALAKADAAATSTNKLGMCVLAAAGADAATKMLMPGGYIRADTLFDTFTVGAPLYISAATAGKIVSTAPTGTVDFVVRPIGSAEDANTVFFNPAEVPVTIDASSNVKTVAGVSVGGGTAPVFGRVVRTAGDITTTSTSLVDATGATVTFTTGAFPVSVLSTFSNTNSGASGTNYFNIAIDGALELGTAGVFVDNTSASFSSITGISHQSAALTAASHTIKLQWKVLANTGTISADTAESFPFCCHEIR